MCQRNESHGMINLQLEEFSKWIHMTTTVPAGHICAPSGSDFFFKWQNYFFSNCAKPFFYSFIFLQEKQFYAEFIRFHIHESEKEKKNMIPIFSICHMVVTKPKKA